MHDRVQKRDVVVDTVDAESVERVVVLRRDIESHQSLFNLAPH